MLFICQPIVRNRKTNRESERNGFPISLPQLCSIILSLLALAQWISLRGIYVYNSRRQPSLTISSVTVPSFNIYSSSSSSLLNAPWNLSPSSSSPSSSLLNATWNISLHFSYPYIPIRRMDCRCVEAFLFYGRHQLSQATMRPFYVHRRRKADTNIVLVAQSKPVDGGTHMAANSSRIAFRIEFHSFIAFHLFFIEFKEAFRAFCEDVEISFEEEASGVDGGGGRRGSAIFHPPFRCRVVRGLVDSNCPSSRLA